jgi:hypothetical protein
MSVRTCDHLKEDGVYCNSPALHGRNYCYFHLNLRGRRLKSARARRHGDKPALNLPFPEDMHAVQIGLAEVMWALAEDRIETKRAWAILNSLQQASNNLNQTARWQGEREAVGERRPLRALNDPNFERRFGLPGSIDLNADPEGAPPLSSGFDDRVGTNSSVGFPVQAELERGFSPGGPDLSSDNCLPATDNQPLTTDNCSDRVPIPEDEMKELQMTKWEKMEFFLYRCRIDRELSEEKEQALKLAWLRAKRRLTRAQYVAAQRDGSEDASMPMDGPEMNDSKEPPFGFGNTVAEAGAEDKDEAA